MSSAAVGEVVRRILVFFLLLFFASSSFLFQAACLTRVPIEIIKQRRQAGFHKSSLHILRSILSTEGFFGLYRGYLTTVFREIPFSFIQFPLWEGAKNVWSEKQGRPVSPWQSSICGAVAGEHLHNISKIVFRKLHLNVLNQAGSQQPSPLLSTWLKLELCWRTRLKWKPEATSSSPCEIFTLLKELKGNS